MSEHSQHIYPRYPHLAAPDWPALHARMLETGFLLPSVGEQVPRAALADLSFQIALVPGRGYRHDPAMRTAADVLALYVESGDLPAGLPLNPMHSIEEAVDLLQSRNIELRAERDEEGCAWRSPQHCLGPAAVACLSPDMRAAYQADPREFGMQLVVYEGLCVPVGENLCQPRLPGSDEALAELEPFGSHIDFIGAAFEDPAVQWTNPADGRAYYILDLDWQYSFGLGTHMICAHGLDQQSTEALAAATGQLADQPMACHHCHL
jgi:hypothetical protein